MSLMQLFMARYYKILSRLFKMNKYAQLITVDFDQHWGTLYKKQAGAIAIVVLGEICNNIFLSMPALLLEYFIAHGTSYFGYFVMVWVGILLLELFSDFNATKTMVQCLQSVHYAANQRLLNVDPIFHQSSTKGKALAKIYRGAEAYQEVFRSAIYELLPMIVGVTTVVISFLAIDYLLGLLVLGLLSLLTILSVVLFLFSAHVLVPLRIDADDKVKNLGTESLMQMSLIRATFSAQQIDMQLKNANKHRLSVEGNSLRSYDIISSFTKVAYVVIFAITGFYILHLMSVGTITHVTGVALLVTFFSGTYQLLAVGQYLYRFKDHLTRVKDLFAYMRSYGRQTFPVLVQGATNAESKKREQHASVRIIARTLKFRYNQDAPVFSGQTLQLALDAEQSNKLYGIIGYSGQGKSTLLSILGGQLKPHVGTVTINGVNIYAIDDEQRRSLITFQNQGSSGFYGSIRYNLLFGLPKNHGYDDQKLIDILGRVGLWHMLEQKRGLDTKVSEGGLALSSGQRQRLDFAGVYLRAQYYRPACILLDEPTSNLDEENEHNVIAMMQELARKSVVIVISHRLRTLEKTCGILDLSLQNSKELVFMAPTELAQCSPYYRQLLTGTVVGALSKKPSYDIEVQQALDMINSIV